MVKKGIPPAAFIPPCWEIRNKLIFNLGLTTILLANKKKKLINNCIYAWLEKSLNIYLIFS